VQGHELQLGTNCIGHFLFAEKLAPLLTATAAAAPAGSVRAVWVSSGAIRTAPSGGINWDDINWVKGGAPFAIYGQSKVGSVFLAHEFGEKHTGVVSVVSGQCNRTR
jgi:retinol dehydrogenase-12